MHLHLKPQGLGEKVTQVIYNSVTKIRVRYQFTGFDSLPVSQRALLRTILKQCCENVFSSPVYASEKSTSVS